MGGVACRLADRVVLTDDNPRSEDPLRIIEEIRAGCVDARGTDAPQVQPDRRLAITDALGRARPGDVVLIAGKGHETGPGVRVRTEPFDDREVAREVLVALGHGAGTT